MLTLSTIRDGAATREALMNGLKVVRGYPGIHSKIGFSEKRVNTWVWILQYNGDQIQRVDEFNVQ